MRGTKSGECGWWLAATTFLCTGSDHQVQKKHIDEMKFIFDNQVTVHGPTGQIIPMLRANNSASCFRARVFLRHFGKTQLS